MPHLHYITLDTQHDQGTVTILTIVAMCVGGVCISVLHIGLYHCKTILKLFIAQLSESHGCANINTHNL